MAVPQKLDDLFKKEIEFSKGTGMPVFTMGLMQGYDLVKKYYSDKEEE